MLSTEGYNFTSGQKLQILFPVWLSVQYSVGEHTLSHFVYSVKHNVVLHHHFTVNHCTLFQARAPLCQKKDCISVTSYLCPVCVLASYPAASCQGLFNHLKVKLTINW